jgi:hypothetical protein
MKSQDYEKSIGDKKEVFRNALITAFQEDEIIRLVDDNNILKYANEIPQNKDYEVKIFTLINWCESEGCLAELLGAAFRKKPQNPELKNFYQLIFRDEKIREELKEKNLNKHFEKIVKSLEEGNLVFFVGSGINSSDDCDFDFKAELEFPPSDERIAYVLAKKLGIEIKKLIGFPCEICPFHKDQRPKGNARQPLCPVLKNIEEKTEQQRLNRQQLPTEQDLTFARLEIKCYAQYAKEIFDENIQFITKKFREIYNQDYQPSSVQKTLANIICSISKQDGRFPLIITTNYDYGLEKAFEEKEQNINVLYYQIYEDPKEARSSIELISYKIDGNPPKYKEINIENRKIEPTNQELPEELLILNEKLKEPTIVRLYGGDIYQQQLGEADRFDSFAIAGINSPRDLKKRLPDWIGRYCKHKNILFLGYTANDTELHDILKYLISYDGKSEYRGEASPEGWLINQSDPGVISNNYWGRQRVNLDIEYPWGEYIQKLQKYCIDEKKGKP